MEWEKEVHDTTIPTREKNKKLMTSECREDMKSMVIGFYETAKILFSAGCTSILPSRMNNDVVENFFCQQRTLYNGANKNPNHHQYAYTINSIIQCQVSIMAKGKRSNSGQLEMPYSHMLGLE